MKCVREVLSSLNEVFSNDTMRPLVDQLAIISQMIYKINNAQRHYKFFQATRKLDRNMRKFIQSGLIQLTKDNLKLLGERENFDPSYAKSYTEKLDVVIKRSLILLGIVQNNCMEITIWCKKELSIERFIPLNSVLVSCSSKVYSLIKFLEKEIYAVYEDLCVFTNKENSFAPLMKAKKELNASRKRKRKKTTVLDRFANHKVERKAPKSTFNSTTSEEIDITIQNLSESESGKIIDHKSPLKEKDESAVDFGKKIDRKSFFLQNSKKSSEKCNDMNKTQCNDDVGKSISRNSFLKSLKAKSLVGQVDKADLRSKSQPTLDLGIPVKIRKLSDFSKTNNSNQTHSNADYGNQSPHKKSSETDNVSDRCIIENSIKAIESIGSHQNIMTSVPDQQIKKKKRKKNRRKKKPVLENF